MTLLSAGNRIDGKTDGILLRTDVVQRISGWMQRRTSLFSAIAGNPLLGQNLTFSPAGNVTSAPEGLTTFQVQV